jgi:hypothetical protein
MTPAQRDISRKLRILNYAKQIGNITAAAAISAFPARSSTAGSEHTRKMVSKRWLTVNPALRTRSSAQNRRWRKNPPPPLDISLRGSSGSPGTSSSTTASPSQPAGCAPILAASAGSGVLKFLPRHAQSSVFGREDDGKVFSDDLFLQVAKNLLRPRVPTENAPLGVKPGDRMISHLLHHQAEELVTERPWRFSLLPSRAFVHRRCPPDVRFDLRGVSFIPSPLILTNIASGVQSKTNGSFHSFTPRAHCNRLMTLRVDG